MTNKGRAGLIGVDSKHLCGTVVTQIFVHEEQQGTDRTLLAFIDPNLRWNHSFVSTYLCTPHTAFWVTTLPTCTLKVVDLYCMCQTEAMWRSLAQILGLLLCILGLGSVACTLAMDHWRFVKESVSDTSSHIDE